MLLFYFVWFFFVILGFYLDCYRGFVKFFGVAKLARFDCFFFFVVVVWLTSQVGWVCGEYFYADLTGFDERFLRITEFLVVVVVFFFKFYFGQMDQRFDWTLQRLELGFSFVLKAMKRKINCESIPLPLQRQMTRFFNATSITLCALIEKKKRRRFVSLWPRDR